MFRGRNELRALFVLAAALLLAACERTGPSFQQMGRQPKYDPLEPSAFFGDGMSARPRIAGTVARGEVSNNPFMDSGKIAGQEGDGFPMPVTEQVLNRGHERFNIYCSECHGRLGDGNGMIPSRGYRRPPSFHTEALRNAKTGHFFDVMTNGFGAMPPYAVQVPVADRWAIIAYIRALQLSQNGTMNDVPVEERAKMGSPVVGSPVAGSPVAPAPHAELAAPASSSSATDDHGPATKPASPVAGSPVAPAPHAELAAPASSSSATADRRPTTASTPTRNPQPATTIRSSTTGDRRPTTPAATSHQPPATPPGVAP